MENLEKEEKISNTKKSKYLAGITAALVLTLAACDKDSSKTYIVKEGDNFFSILKKEGISPTSQNVDIIKKTNHIKNINQLQIGQKIFFPKNVFEKSDYSEDDKNLTMNRSIEKGFEKAKKLGLKISISPAQARAQATKESHGHFDAVSSGGAVGYMQLKDGAIQSVFNVLRQNGIDQNFDPKHNKIDNVLFGLVYFSHLEQKLKSNGINKNIFEYTLAAYNGGDNKILALYEKFGRPSREVFEKKLLALANMNNNYKMSYSRSYGVKYKDYFYDLPKGDYDRAVRSSSRNGYDLRITGNKIKEILDYVNIIKSIEKND